MSPGGHLLTSAVAGAGAFAATGSPLVSAAVVAGGFLIDVDHVVDYIVFDGERDLRPVAFLRHYLEGRLRHAVLVLHAYELFLLLGVLAWQTASPILTGYLLGATMHLAFDLCFNGELTPRSIVAFYSFTYRAAHRFDADVLLGRVERAPTSRFWFGFFLGARPASETQPHAEPSGTRASMGA